MTIVVDAIAAGFTIATGAVAIEKFIQKKRKERKQRKVGTENLSDRQDLVLAPRLRGGRGSEPSESVISVGTATTTTGSRYLEALGQSLALFLSSEFHQADIRTKPCKKTPFT
jgi:hypothetical protein